MAETAREDLDRIFNIRLRWQGNAAPMNVESHAGESITGDLMSKAW